MKILFLIRSLDFGGAERQLIVLANGLAVRGHDVSVATFYGGGQLGSSLDARVRAYSLDKRGRWDTLGFLSRLARLLRKVRPDVLHSYLNVPNIIASLCRPLLPGTRIVWGIRASDVKLENYDRLTGFAYRTEARLARMADLIIANSQSGKAHCVRLGYPEQRILVIPNGIDTERFHPDPKAGLRVRAEWGIAESEKVVGMVARLDPMKGHPHFLRAAARVARARGDVWFVCIGDGPASYKAELMHLSTSLGLDRRVIWASVRLDMPAVYCAFDLAVLSSVFGEGFPNVVGEAMACGIPCVATDVGDTAAIVGESGVVVPVSNDIRLASAIENLLTDAKERGRIARQRITDIASIASLILETERVLRS